MQTYSKFGLYTHSTGVTGELVRNLSSDLVNLIYILSGSEGCFLRTLIFGRTDGTQKGTVYKYLKAIHLQIIYYVATIY